MTSLDSSIATRSSFAQRRWIRWISPFQIDLRALAAMRIGLGLSLLYDLVYRTNLVRIYYTDWGVTPRSALGDGSARLSLFALDGGFAWAASLFGVHIVTTILFTIGYRTRAAAIACLLLTYSMINRNPVLTHAGHALAMWLLFWSVFLPMSAAASVDARLAGVDRRGSRQRRACSVATVAILWQVLFVYWGALAAKSDSSWTSDLTGVYFLLHSHLGTPLGSTLAQSTGVTAAIVLFTFALEGMGPILVLLSCRLPRIRTLIVFGFFAFHLGIALTIYVSSFAAICCAAWLPFLPREFWDFATGSRATRWAVGGWHRLTAGIAGGLARVPLLRRATVTGQRLGPAMRIALAILLAYVCVANVLSDLPDRVVRSAGPLARLPRLKQSWGVMSGVARAYATVAFQASYADGSTHAIGPADAPGGEFRWTLPRATSRDEYFRPAWLPVESGPTVAFRNVMLQGVQNANDPQVVAFTDFHRRLLQAARGPGQPRLTKLELYVVYEATPDPKAIFKSRPRPQRQLIYAWPDGAPNAARPVPEVTRSRR